MRAKAGPDSMRAKWLIVKLPNGWADTSTHRPIMIAASNGRRSAPSIIGRRMVNKDIRKLPPLIPIFKCVKTVVHRGAPQGNEEIKAFFTWVFRNSKPRGTRRTRGCFVLRFPVIPVPPSGWFNLNIQIEDAINDFSVFSVTSVAIHQEEHRRGD